MKSILYRLVLLLSLVAISYPLPIEAVPDRESTSTQEKIESLILKRYQKLVESRTDLWLDRDDSYQWKRRRLAFEYRYIYGLNQTPEEIFQKASDHLARLRREMESLALKISPQKNYQQFLKDLKDDRPKNRGELLALYKKEIVRSKKFVIKNDLVSVPNYARSVTAKLGNPKSGYAFGYFKRPSWRNPEGVFVVIPPSKRDNQNTRKQRLRSHNRHWARVVAPHEGIPGHHLQMILWMNSIWQNKYFFYNPSYIEGWGLYCEDMLREVGYYKDRKTIFAQKQMQAWRAARVLVEQGMYLGYFTKKEAISLLEDTVGLEPLAARLEVEKQIRRPHYYSGYFTGYLKIRELRARAKKKLGKDFSLKWFHDTLLSTGPLPYDLIEKIFEIRIRERLQKKSGKK